MDDSRPCGPLCGPLNIFLLCLCLYQLVVQGGEQQALRIQLQDLTEHHQLQLRELREQQEQQHDPQVMQQHYQHEMDSLEEQQQVRHRAN